MSLGRSGSIFSFSSCKVETISAARKSEFADSFAKFCLSNRESFDVVSERLYKEITKNSLQILELVFHLLYYREPIVSLAQAKYPPTFITFLYTGIFHALLSTGTHDI